jgi:hypothetical protein
MLTFHVWGPPSFGCQEIQELQSDISAVVERGELCLWELHLIKSAWRIHKDGERWDFSADNV